MNPTPSPTASDGAAYVVSALEATRALRDGDAQRANAALGRIPPAHRGRALLVLADVGITGMADAIGMDWGVTADHIITNLLCDNETESPA